MPNVIQEVINGVTYDIKDANARDILKYDYNEKMYTMSPNLYNKDNAGIKPGYYATGNGWLSSEGDSKLGSTHPIYLYAGKTYKWRSAYLIYGDVRSKTAFKVMYPGDGTILSADNTGTLQDDFYTVTINESAWYVFNIDMRIKDSFMLCLADQYPSSYVGYDEPVAVITEQGRSADMMRKMNTISPNMFDKYSSDIQTTRYISGNSWTSSGGNIQYGSTHPIYCIKGATYKFIGYYLVYGINANKAWRIDDLITMSIAESSEGVWDSDNYYVEWTCPKDGYYVVNINKVYIDSYMFCLSSAYPSTYIGYGIAKISEDCPNVFVTFDNDGTPAHVSIAKYSPNLFNANDPNVNTERYATGRGWTSSDGNPQLAATHPIFLSSGKTYKWKGYYTVYGDYNSTSVFGINENTGNIAWVDTTGTWSDASHAYVIFTCSESGYYVINTDGTKMSTFMVCEQNEYPAHYAEYGVLYANGMLKFDDADFHDYPLSNKVLICDGDSIGSANSDNPRALGGWFGRLEINQHISGSNYSVNGGTITYIDSTRHCISRNIDSIHNSYNELDYLILEGGTNDADLIGSFNGNTPPANFGTWTENDYSGEYDDTTFCGAFEAMLYKALTYWPNAHIGYIVAMEMGNGSAAINRKRYFDEAVKIAKKWHIPVLNLWENSGMDSRLTAFYDPEKNENENVAAGKFYIDGQHPSSYGYDKMQPMIEAWVKSI